jgi:hypothetical protein
VDSRSEKKALAMGRVKSEGDAEPYRGFKAGPIIIKLSVCHAPPPGLAFGEPDDRLLGGIQCAAASRSITSAADYWITRFRG